MENILGKAIQSAQQSDIAYCKFLSANDTKATRGHQSGYLVSKSAWEMFLPQAPVRGDNIKVNVTIKWQDDFETSSTFTYYGVSKDEFRLTNFGKGFPYREENNVGDLFVLSSRGEMYFEAFILSSDEDIEDFFAALNITSIETNRIICSRSRQPEMQLAACFTAFIRSLNVDFPSTIELAVNARDCYNRAHQITPQLIKQNPDKEILGWLDAEFQLFKAIENNCYARCIQAPFSSVEDLVRMANSILNRRKSRAGKSLEHHLFEIFKTFELQFVIQPVTEGKKKPDFLFPSIQAYHNLRFNADKIVILAAKTTCKDRWRQVLNEADRVKTKYLFTLQQGISRNQLEEMYKYNVCLVVPRPYLSTFPEEFRQRILTLNGLVKYIQLTQQ